MKGIFVFLIAGLLCTICNYDENILYCYTLRWLTLGLAIVKLLVIIAQSV